MASSFLKILAKAKLVELDDVEQNIEIAPVVEPIAIVENIADNIFKLEITEGKALEEIYTESGLIQPTFTAEKLLKLIDGLRSMDAITRKTAIVAMDKADDSWNIDNCITDAASKINILTNYKKNLVGILGIEEKNSIKTISDIQKKLEETITEIKTQIKELEHLLEREISKITQMTTNIEAGIRTMKETSARETRRIDSEIEKLSEITAVFNTEKKE